MLKNGKLNAQLLPNGQRQLNSGSPTHIPPLSQGQEGSSQLSPKKLGGQL